jgi:hypothetical protein
MKAKEYVAKLEAATGEEQTQILMQFFAETGELVLQRTKNSDIFTLGGCRDGVIREQKDKFRAICNKVSWLKPEMFDELLEKCLPTLALEQKKYLTAIKTGVKMELPVKEEITVVDRNIKKNSLGGPGRKLAAQATK